MATVTHDELFKEWFDESTQAEIEVEEALVDVAIQTKKMVQDSGVPQREIAKRMGHESPSTVTRIINPTRGSNPTVETLIRLARVCGYSFQAEFAKVTNVVAAEPAAVMYLACSSVSPSPFRLASAERLPIEPAATAALKEPVQITALRAAVAQLPTRATRDPPPRQRADWIRHADELSVLP